MATTSISNEYQKAWQVVEEEEEEEEDLTLLDDNILEDMSIDLTLAGMPYFDLDELSDCSEDSYIHEERGGTIPQDLFYGISPTLSSPSSHSSPSSLSDEDAQSSNTFSQLIQYSRLHSCGSDSTTNSDPPSPTGPLSPTGPPSPTGPFGKTEQVKKRKQRSKGRGNDSLKNKPTLPRFVAEMLGNSAYNPEIIKWLNQNEGVFLIVKPKKIAELWGLRKGNPRMNYPSMSRGIRERRKYGYFESVPLDAKYPKKLTYKWGPKAETFWNK